MVETIDNALITIDGYVWGVPLIAFILIGGIILTIRTRGVQFRKLPLAFKWIFINEKGNDNSGEVSSFSSLMTALSATVGTGNMVGVATAVASGGPGALFWMVVTALIGMATKYAEGFLAIKYREFDDSGNVLGGPFAYIEKGLGKKWTWLAKIFAINGLCAGLFGIGTVTQVNGIVKSINDYFNPEGVQSVNLPALGGFSWITIIASIVIATLVAIIIFGGIKRISKVASVVVPFMAILYFILGILVIILNITEVPAAIAIIIEAAFDPKAFTGGIVGSVFVAMQKGMSRGIFSNEAGLGSAPIAAAAAKTKEPVRQGLISMTGTFIDTIIICNITGIAIVLTGAWQIEGFEGVQITTYAFQKALPFPDEITAFIIMICLVFFAFTSILGWNYYSERCMTYLNGGKSKTIKIYNALYTIAVFAGPYMTVTAVWTISDILNGLMALPNMIALFALSGVIGKETREFFKNKNKNAK